MMPSEINIRDPFVLPYKEKYYMYGTRGETCWGECDGFDVYVSNNLDKWNGPYEVFHKPEGFWADINYWAPEVHYYNGLFYAFVSFKSKDKRRGTQILISDNPIGPFLLHSNGPVTPPDWECLDGTFYVDEKGLPHIIFCHEWVQIGDGEICDRRLSPDLREAISDPVCLFTASQSILSHPIRNGSNYVTDGPFIYKPDKHSVINNKTIIMLWSTMSVSGYVQLIARSESGNIIGPWKHDEKPLYYKDGGHGMIFRAFDGILYLTLHSPNINLMERPVFIKIDEELLIS